MEELRVLLGGGRAEIEIKKSKFLCEVCPVSSEEKAKKIIAKVQGEHKKADHHVYAYLIGLDPIVQRFSDDGEPKGTAGRPILEVIRKEGLCNTLVVVARYFGGIRLGAGGLTRAYSEAARKGIESAGTRVRKTVVELELVLPYDMMDQVLHIVEQKKGLIKKERFAEVVCLAVEIEKIQEKTFLHKLKEVSGARIQSVRLGEHLR